MLKPLTNFTLALANIKRKPYRSLGLCALVGFLAMVLFAGSVQVASLRNGLLSAQERFGADLAVVPKGYEGGYESVLLKGEPSYFYMDKSATEIISQIEGVEKATAQFFLTSTSESCCSALVQMIAFDDATDFVIKPWISTVLDRPLKDGELIAGRGIQLNEGKITIFGTEYPVVAQLAPTGTGMDNSIFFTMNTAHIIAKGAEEKQFNFFSQSDFKNDISTVLVKLKESADPFTTSIRIRAALNDVQILTSQTILSNISNTFGSFKVFFYFFAALFLAITIVTLSIVFSVSINERKKEWGILQTLGATKSYVAGILLKEATLLSFSGAAIGIALGAMIVFPFNYAIGKSTGLPYLQGSILSFSWIFVLSLLIGTAAGPISALFSLKKILRAEVYLTVRQGE